MTKKEIEKMAYKAYPVKNDTEYDKYGNAETVDLNAGRREGYIRAMTEMRGLAKKFGEREAKLILDFEKLPKLHGWVARQPDGTLWLFEECRPCLVLGEWGTAIGGERELDGIDTDEFADLTYDSEPVEVELLVRKVGGDGRPV